MRVYYSLHSSSFPILSHRKLKELQGANYFLIVLVLHSFVLSLSYCVLIGALSFDWCVIFPQSWPAVAVYKRRQQVFRLTYSSFFQQKYQKRIGEFKHQKKGHGDSPLLWFLVNDNFFLIFPPTRFIEYKFYGLQNSVAFQLIRAFPHCQSQRSSIYKKWKISQQ